VLFFFDAGWLIGMASFVFFFFEISLNSGINLTVSEKKCRNVTRM